MTQITLRISDPEMEQALRRKAKETGKSLNKVVLELLRGGIGLKRDKKKAPGASLAEFAGKWTEQDVREFEEAIRSCEQIDEEMWK